MLIINCMVLVSLINKKCIPFPVWGQQLTPLGLKVEVLVGCTTLNPHKNPTPLPFRSSVRFSLFRVVAV